MSRLDSILNPELDFKATLRPEMVPSPAISLASPSSSTSNAGETSHYVHKTSDYEVHESHDRCPDNLDCLPNTDGRPQHTLPIILRAAILGSPKKRLTIREIYAAMESKYPYYRTAGQTWKQSVRHHLSLNRLFEKQPRPVTDPGFGSYWTVNLTAPPGTKRPRKRGRPKGDPAVDDNNGEPRKRGRPRKVPLTGDTAMFDHPPIATLPIPIHDQRAGEGPCHISALRTGGGMRGHILDEDEVDEIMPLDERNPINPEDDYESEDEITLDIEPRSDTPVFETASPPCMQNQAPGPVMTRLPPMRVPFDGPENIIDRLRIEMDGLRRQSAEAVSVSMRMSDQLSEAQAEASRARAALKAAESMLQEETRRRQEAERSRQEAERAADDEARMRMEAEDQLKNIQHQWRTPIPHE